MNSCDCGMYNCGYCRPHLLKLDERERKQKAVPKKKPMIMPFGKYKGKIVRELPPLYCKVLLQHQEKDIKKRNPKLYDRLYNRSLEYVKQTPMYPDPDADWNEDFDDAYFGFDHGDFF